MAKRARIVVASLVVLGLVGAQSSAQAQDELPHVFLEGTGAYGAQLGDIEYLPAGAPGAYEFPIVHGPAVGGTAGVFVAPNLALVANYEYTWAATVEGDIVGVLDRVQGYVDYHTTMVGFRLAIPMAYGAIQAEVDAGVLFPFHTTLEYDYGAALTQLPVPISGTGTRVTNFSVGFGGQALLGYQMPVTDNFYFALNLKIKVMQTENSGERTELRNFVTDFEAVPPTATTADIQHGEGAAQPQTRGINEARLQLAMGAQF